jgi:selenocysteine-specific elongation factor
LERSILATKNSLIIASKLDTDLEANICRIAFYGNVLQAPLIKDLFSENSLRIFRRKTKSGKVEKIIDNYTLLVKDLFKKETNINLFIGKTVVLKNTLNKGRIDSAFGKSGKVKAFFEKGVFYTETK